MSQPQDPVTEQLVTFIQSIQLRRGSGRLTVKRGKETSLEEGSIVFVNGQVTEAKVGRYTGSEALNRLSTWESYQFSFVVHHSSRGAHLEPTHIDKMGKPLAAAKPDRPNTQPLSPRLNGKSKGPETPLPFFPLTSAQQDLNLNRTRVPQPSSRFRAALQLIELMGLSRAHRRLFLLIDGKRSIDELAHLLGRTSDEVSQLLGDLERENLF